MFLKIVLTALSLNTLAYASVCKSELRSVESSRERLAQKYNYRPSSEFTSHEIEDDFKKLKVITEKLRKCERSHNQFMTSCLFKAHLLEKKEKDVEILYSQGAQLEDSFQHTCQFYSNKKFKYYINAETKKVLLTDINGLYGLRSYLDCRLDSEIETNRRINFSQREEKYSKLTIIDDWLYPDTRPDQYEEYPLGIQYLNSAPIEISIRDGYINIQFGKYYTRVENQLGKIVESNLLAPNVYDNGRCSTIIDRRTNKLIPEIQVFHGKDLKKKVISY